MSVFRSIVAEVDVDLVKKLSHTEGFDADDLLVTRRDTTFPIQLKSRSLLTVKSATLVYEEGKEVDLGIGKIDSRIHGSSVQVSKIVAL